MEYSKKNRLRLKSSKQLIDISIVCPTCVYRNNYRALAANGEEMLEKAGEKVNLYLHFHLLWTPYQLFGERREDFNRQT